MTPDLNELLDTHCYGDNMPPKNLKPGDVFMFTHMPNDVFEILHVVVAEDNPHEYPLGSFNTKQLVMDSKEHEPPEGDDGWGGFCETNPKSDYEVRLFKGARYTCVECGNEMKDWDYLCENCQ